METKKRFPVIAYALVFLLAVTCVLAYTPAKWAAKAAEKPVVVVDPGHIYIDGGGHDPGAVASDKSTDESKLNPVLANKIAQQLLKRGYNVYSTLKIADNIPVLMGEQVPYISHTGRAQASNKAKADIFISVHHNSNISGKFDTGAGTEVLYCPNQWAAGMAAESKKLAQSVYNSVASLAYTRGNRATPVKTAGAYVLLKNNAPAITFEAGFLTNRTDLANVKDPAKQDQIAAKVADGIAAYLKASNIEKDKAPPTADYINTSKTPSVKPKFSVAAYGVQDDTGVSGVRYEVYLQGQRSKGVKKVAARNQGGGKWYSPVDLAKLFGKTGRYNVDVYATDMAGNSAMVGRVLLTYKKDRMAPEIERINTSKTPSKKPKFSVAAYGVSDESGVKSVQYKVYPTRQRSKAKTVPAKKQGGSKWYAAVDVKKLFGDKAGLYIVDVYATDKANNTDMVGRVRLTYEKDGAPPTLDRMATSQTPSANARFSVTAYGVNDESGVKSVQYKVYPTRQRPKTKTVTARSRGGGKWYAAVDIKRLFDGKEGLYIVDVYGTDKAGNTDLIDRVKVEYRKGFAG